ncbi:hypothetical protein PDESU_03735 [Pontiella desulfatans]|uniref:T2SS protein K first SAM-like domain-containing protein n=1 Tax=Pontiella desulfatans TaxID=2750659 RepID=A0A6C2U5J9_PONDE|nr:type II secretion system protein GspK [Pontiella desulfatans]VGO15153.1 hypothetical protein PDESU_03735 [Pontiella desulfatans]
MNTDQHSLVRPGSRSGSALILVLAVTVVLAFLVANFSAEIKNELKAAGAHYEEAINTQLARSAFELARLELARGGSLYANGHGDAFLIAGTEDYETEIEELLLYREGIALGRGLLSYRLIHSPSALDPNELGQNDWHRLLEVACDMEEGDERSALVDCIIDWTDEDDIARASGMEEDDYQELDTPRHVKNGVLDSFEELLMVHGMTRELFFGTGNPARVEDGMLWGGGILRYLIGDHSPEGRASAQYVLSGAVPADDDYDEDEELEYSKVETLPEQLYLLASGRIEAEDDTEEADREVVSERIVLVRLRLGEGQDAAYEIDDMMGNAPRETVERVLAYGVPEDD